MSSSTVGVGADDLVTGEAVALDLPHGGIGLRIVSGLIDLVIGYAALLGCSRVATLLGETDDALVAAGITVAAIAALVGIPTTLETLTRGKTSATWSWGCALCATTLDRSASARP